MHKKFENFHKIQYQLLMIGIKFFCFVFGIHPLPPLILLSHHFLLFLWIIYFSIYSYSHAFSTQMFNITNYFTHTIIYLICSLKIGTMLSRMSVQLKPGQLISIQRSPTTTVPHCYLNAPHHVCIVSFFFHLFIFFWYFFYTLYQHHHLILFFWFDVVQLNICHIYMSVCVWGMGWVCMYHHV